MGSFLRHRPPAERLSGDRLIRSFSPTVSSTPTVKRIRNVIQCVSISTSVLWSIGWIADTATAFTLTRSKSNPMPIVPPPTEPIQLADVWRTGEASTTPVAIAPPQTDAMLNQPEGAVNEYVWALQGAALLRDVAEEIEMATFLNVRTIRGPLDEWVPQSTTTSQALVDNPATLLGPSFSGGGSAASLRSGPSELTQRITPITRLGGTVKEVGAAFEGPSSEDVEHQLEAQDRQMGQRFQMQGVDVVGVQPGAEAPPLSSAIERTNSAADGYHRSVYGSVAEPQSIPSILLGLAIWLGMGWLLKQVLRQFLISDDA